VAVTASYRPAPVLPELGAEFFDVVVPARFPQPVPRYRNQRWAARVGLDTLAAAAWERHFAAFEPLPGNLPAPLAMRYHGHQFRIYNPDLGDGRGFVFAQLRDTADDRWLDLGTKGSGQTPWSRGGDGRLTLKGGVREVLASAMLEALGVYTSKGFSLFETGESLYRNDEPSPTRASVLVRLGHSHMRIGTFQRCAFLRQERLLHGLLEHCLRYYVPEAAAAADAAAAFVAAVARRNAALCASWMVAGFVHGVLNSDNMTVTGESFDYGPYRFLPECAPRFVAAYFDAGGLYAYGRQPAAVLWNVERLAEALRPLSSEHALREALREFQPTYARALPERLLARLGVSPQDDASDSELTRAVFGFLEESRAGFDQFFFDWYGGAASAARAAVSPAAARYAGARFDRLRGLLEAYAPAAPERLALPYFQRATPCTLLIDEIEAVWSEIDRCDDWSPFNAKLTAIAELGEALALRD
jgi:uncharacterized protein YdiU (UPF0061 family)